MNTDIQNLYDAMVNAQFVGNKIIIHSNNWVNEYRVIELFPLENEMIRLTACNKNSREEIEFRIPTILDKFIPSSGTVEVKTYHGTVLNIQFLKAYNPFE